MAWHMNRPSMTCNNTLASDNMQSSADDVASGRNGGGEGSAGAIGGKRNVRDPSDGSDGGTKTRRTGSGKVRGNGDDESSSLVSKAMEESTRAYCDGLQQAALTLAKASTKGAEIVGVRIGEMAGKIGAVADAMVGSNDVLSQLVGVLAGRRQGTRRGEWAGDESP
ncbi:hypothetical protein CBR_g41691 [Chara braunii]|uniref:Uncharacterized protein n=1 Tax=Chara braunii TaxID=69332 RepID=A0A388LWC0_CHABU|nr:hypothetical protein CBR_g41691 [Chara braunii]|eukprot:GBG86628.1 hypothetical protein CBR_g41691 [Chara braunii]